MGSSDPSGAGREFLAKKSGLARTRQGLPKLVDILIIDDNSFDADTLRALLHMMFGYGASIRRAKTLGSALDSVIERRPELIFLDDILPPNDTAINTMPFLRRCGYEGPIVVVSGQASRRRKLELVAAGAADVIHKDDLDTVRVTEALAGIYLSNVEGAEAAAPGE